MAFITQGKTNIKYILIVIILATIVGGGILIYQFWLVSKEEAFPPIELPKIAECNIDSDCAPCGSGCAPMETAQKDFCHVGIELNECTCVNNKCVTKDETANLILFEKNAAWGPCPPDVICEQSVKLYYSGELIFEGEINATEQLSKETVGNLINQIRLSNIMGKNCEVTPVLDYMSTLKINLDGQIKEIIFPGCEEEVNKIEKLIPLPKGNERDFCGWSTNGNCASNSDCITGGCSGQVCQSKNEEGVITTCEFRDCYVAENYGLECKCQDSKCQWLK